MLSRVNAVISFVLLFVGWKVELVDACSRILYKSDYGYVTGRSMDWFEPTASDLWAFPAGMERNGGIGKGSLEWTSLYGSVVVSMYGIATADGANTEGLAANVLYLAESKYGEDERPKENMLSVGAWGQYVLDMFATVDEVVEALKDDQISVIAPDLPNGSAATVHLAVADVSGDSAIFEYIDGKLVIHHGPQYRVMTNSPPYDEQLAIEKYFNEIGGLRFMPGTHKAADRFVRLTYNLKSVMDQKPTIKTVEDSVATAMSVMRHISVPYGVSDPDKPNIATTYWRTMFNHKDKIFYYEPVVSYMTFWVNFAKMNLTEGAPIMRLELDDRTDYLGGETSEFFVEEAEPFPFLAPGDEDDGNCVYKNSKPSGIKVIEHLSMRLGRSSRQEDAEGCNEACKTNEKAELFTYNSKNRECTCYKVWDELTLTPKKHRTTAYIMEEFDDKTCPAIPL